MEHFCPRIQVKTKKKGLHQKWNTFFPRIQVDTYTQMHTRVKLSGRDADVDHTQIIGGYSQIIGGYIPPSPQISALLFKMSIKILKLCLVFVLTFKEFVAIFGQQRGAIVKIAVITITLVKRNISTITFCSDYTNKNDIPRYWNKTF